MGNPSASEPSSFLIESSPSAIYRRMTSGYRNALEQQGHRVIYFEPSQYLNFEDALSHYINTLKAGGIDTILIFDNAPLSTFFLKEADCFVFEQSSAFLVFIHHDNIWSSFTTAQLETGGDVFVGWQRVRERSIHFCLEYGNFIDLKMMGFEHVHPIFHGSEFERISPINDYCHEVAFVGHVLPGIHEVFERCEHLECSAAIAADFWHRLNALDHKIAPSAVAYAQRMGNPSGSPAFIQRRSLYQYTVSLLSTSFRGELIKRLAPLCEIAIVGGDPAYLSSTPSHRVIAKEHICYYPPTANYHETRNVYSRSRINLNITGIQFDDAVTNRVIDVGACGGFILTDWRTDLSKITTVSEAISYRTIDELNDKIDYYLSHEQERLDIAAQLHQDVMRHCTYPHLVKYILSRIAAMSETQTTTNATMVCVDLGCGPHKPDGFIGVDVFPGMGVDIVADLNQSFPFPDNSVDFVRAYDSIEHLSDRLHTMNEIWRICKPGALVDIRVPSTDGRGAFQDPTHISYWNINSFKYYTVEFPGYLELCRRYGFNGAFSIVDLKHEDETTDHVIHVKAVLKAIKSENYLVDYLTEKLRLKQINLMAFPDWLQPGADLYQVFSDILRSLAQNGDRATITLLIDKGNFPEESEITLEEALYELALNLFLTEGIDVANHGPEISLVENLSFEEYKTLVSLISHRIALPQENTGLLNALGAEDLPVWDLGSG